MTRERRSKQAAMSRVVFGCAGLLWTLGCGGDNGPGPSSAPDIAGTWAGTEITEIRSGCTGLLPGTRTGDIFDITQDGTRLAILHLGNCFHCRFSGMIDGDGAFSASASVEGGGSVRITGQVTENRMTARRIPVGLEDCSGSSEYDLTLE